MKDTYDSAKDKVTGTYDSTKDKMREAAESAQPHNDMEAIKSSGGHPYRISERGLQLVRSQLNNR